MKKILEVAPYHYMPFSSGGQKSIALYLQYLGKEVSLTVVSVDDNRFPTPPSYQLIPLLKRSSLRYANLSLLSKISKMVQKNQINYIVWEHPYFAWLAWYIKKLTGVKTVLHTHNIEYLRFQSTGKWWWPILKRYEKWFFRFADHIFFKTEEERDFAVIKWKIEKKKCLVVPFGVDIKEYPADRDQCKAELQQKHYLDRNEKILLYNGLLSYKPNLDGLMDILSKINPVLLRSQDFHYKIIICGKGLPPELNNLADYLGQNIIYAGFVDDIETYFKGSDIFLNPIQSGGGIKTKMVEAIGFGTTVVSTKTGATGIIQSACGDKLKIVDDNDWESFARVIIERANQQAITPRLYYDTYYWGNIAKCLSDFFG